MSKALWRLSGITSERAVERSNVIDTYMSALHLKQKEQTFPSAGVEARAGWWSEMESQRFSLPYVTHLSQFGGITDSGPSGELTRRCQAYIYTLVLQTV